VETTAPEVRSVLLAILICVRLRTQSAWKKPILLNCQKRRLLRHFSGRNGQAIGVHPTCGIWMKGCGFPGLEDIALQCCDHRRANRRVLYPRQQQQVLPACEMNGTRGRGETTHVNVARRSEQFRKLEGDFMQREASIVNDARPRCGKSVAPSD
jgi:hypothetical protein